MKKSKTNILKNFLTIAVIFLLGSAGIIFSILYFDSFSSGFVNKYRTLLIVVTTSVITILSLFTVLLMSKNRGFIYKICLIAVVLLNLSLTIIYILSAIGFWDKIHSVDEFRDYIASFGNYAVAIFVSIQFLQVVILPIPSFITVGAGVLLFGALKGAIFSYIGITLGSLVAFFIGRNFGEKIVKWLIGDKALKKTLKLLKGKDKIILTFMFLFPFFPDDLLCFVSGISSMSALFFVIMISIVRLITIFTSSFSMNNNFIPYDTWWGLVIWVILFALTILASTFIYKKSDNIERFIKSKQKPCKYKQKQR